MNWILRATLLVLLWILVLAPPAAAQYGDLADVFRDGLYGGLIGALVGAATLPFADEPEDHLDRIAIGAGVGVIAGTAYGIYVTTRALVEVRDGQIAWRAAVPRVVTDGSPVGGPVRTPVLYEMTLFRLHF